MLKLPPHTSSVASGCVCVTVCSGAWWENANSAHPQRVQHEAYGPDAGAHVNSDGIRMTNRMSPAHVHAVSLIIAAMSSENLLQVSTSLSSYPD